MLLFCNHFFILIFVIDNTKLTKCDDTTITQKKNTSVNESTMMKDALLNIDHTFLTNNEKMDYIIGK